MTLIRKKAVLDIDCAAESDSVSEEEAYANDGNYEDAGADETDNAAAYEEDYAENEYDDAPYEDGDYLTIPEHLRSLFAGFTQIPELEDQIRRMQDALPLYAEQEKKRQTYETLEHQRTALTQNLKKMQNQLETCRTQEEILRNQEREAVEARAALAECRGRREQMERILVILCQQCPGFLPVQLLAHSKAS